MRRSAFLISPGSVPARGRTTGLARRLGCYDKLSADIRVWETASPGRNRSTVKAIGRGEWSTLSGVLLNTESRTSGILAERFIGNYGSERRVIVIIIL